MRKIRCFLFLFLWSAVPFFSIAAGDPIREARPEEPARIDWKRGELQLFPLTAQYIVVAGDYTDMLDSQLLQSYGKRLMQVEKAFSAGRLKPWAFEFRYNFAAQEISGRYHPQLRNRFENKDFFHISVDGHPEAVAANGYWLNAIGLWRVPRAGRRDHYRVQAAELIHFAYLKLAEPLKNGQILTVTTGDGNQAQLKYDDATTLSRAIKVNQEGYSTEAGEKYAYLGMWLGTLGELPAEEFNGREFRICRSSDGSVVHTGKIALRSREQFHRHNQERYRLNGETVMELDFSDFNTPGDYFISIPGVGRSWEFKLAPTAFDRAFYVQMRGLFHQRSGIEKSATLTGWPMPARQKGSWRGGFAPNDQHYNAQSGCFRDSAGKAITVRPFDMIRATATEEFLPEVYGGWWDAGDFDRRTYHFQIIEDLTSVYLMFPENFSDGQLDLPESGNGIPDILDEAAWGADVWRRAQNAAGGVGCWLEAVSHPQRTNPFNDPPRYYLALPTRESSLEYAAYAAKLAFALKRAGALEKARLFHDSAARAFRYALEPANRQKKEFTLPKVGKVTYQEPEELPRDLIYKAAFNLYAFDDSCEEYQAYLGKENFNAALRSCFDNRRSPYFLSELMASPRLAFTEAAQYRKRAVEEAGKLLKTQQELAYRNVHWPLGHGFFLFMRWGASLPFQKGRALVAAWSASGEKRYRDALFLLGDWMLGANPMGRSLTTGLGKVYPVRLLSHPQWLIEETVPDPIPGLTPYTYAGPGSAAAREMIYLLQYRPRKDFDYPGVQVSLMPHALSDRQDLTPQQARPLLDPYIPLWRNFANLEGFDVAANEFTVWETISPAAAGFGVLIEPGMKPDPAWKKVQPQKDIKKIPGRLFLP